MLPTSSPLTTSVPDRTLAFTTPRSPMIRVSGDAISPWNFPLRRTVPVNVYLPSMSEPSSRKAVSFLRLATAAWRLRGHMGPLRLRPEAGGPCPRSPGAVARGPIAPRNTCPIMRAVLGLAAAAPSARGRGYNPSQIGASGGIAFRTGDLGTGTNTGYNTAVVVGYKPQLLPISVRAEAAYNQFGRTGGGSSVNIPSFTGNVVYELPLGMSFTPYAIGGAGLYRPSVGFNGGGATRPENDFGWKIDRAVKIPITTS